MEEQRFTEGNIQINRKHLKLALEYLGLNVFQPLAFNTHFSESLFITQRYFC